MDERISSRILFFIRYFSFIFINLLFFFNFFVISSRSLFFRYFITESVFFQKYKGQRQTTMTYTLVLSGRPRSGVSIFARLVIPYGREEHVTLISRPGRNRSSRRVMLQTLSHRCYVRIHGIRRLDIHAAAVPNIWFRSRRLTNYTAGYDVTRSLLGVARRPWESPVSPPTLGGHWRRHRIEAILSVQPSRWLSLSSVWVVNQSAVMWPTVCRSALPFTGWEFLQMVLVTTRLDSDTRAGHVDSDIQL